jgi:hypothetical protein
LLEILNGNVYCRFGVKTDALKFKMSCVLYSFSLIEDQSNGKNIGVGKKDKLARRIIWRCHSSGFEVAGLKGGKRAEARQQAS